MGFPPKCSSRPSWFIPGFTTFAGSRNHQAETDNRNIATALIDLTNHSRHSTANGTIDRQTFAASAQETELERLKHRGTEVTEETL
ncbi:MAG: hypothetical protein CBB71_14610 [Rhodopirellula sp. TMED11]|nr:MAG: hypothetical protein CBB71_14610 [Rhodopirellula sp. TMED11]